MRNTRSRRFGVLILAALLASSCSNPEKQKVQHLERGDQYAAEKRDEFAVIEYASALKIDPKFGEARFKLAQTYERLENMRAAAPEYVRAADVLPDNREAQIKATQILLIGQRFGDAQARAKALLAKNPKDVEALLLHAAAMASLRDPEGAIGQIEEALKVSPDSSPAFLNLGAVRMQGGQSKEAEAAFRHAVELAPSSVNAKVALANFLWATERTSEAEGILKEALTLDPKNLVANRMLGMLYVATRRVREAEQPLKVLAESTKTPAARFQLADYYTSVGRRQDAANVLTPLSSNRATFVEAEARLAALEYADNRVAEAHKRLDNVLGRAPNHAGALAMKARWLTTEGKLDEALDRAKAAVAADRQSVAAQFTLATVHDRRGKLLTPSSRSARCCDLTRA